MIQPAQNTLLQKALHRENTDRPPIWLMRQAGRYHSHYQALRKEHGFVDLCKVPKLAAETAMGPMRDFGFDAAILFSDLLFPLEAIGMPLEYSPGPKLGFLLSSDEQIDAFPATEIALKGMEFQRDTVAATRAALPMDQSLIGFVGAPWTLFVYATVGSHKSDLSPAFEGLKAGRFDRFCEHFIPLMAQNMSLQAQGGVDAMAIMDTSAGDLTPEVFRDQIARTIKDQVALFKAEHPSLPVLYYSRGTTPAHWDALHSAPVDGIGIDWRQPIDQVLLEYGEQWAIQGNFDPHHLPLDSGEFERELNSFLSRVSGVPRAKRSGWICGLGHGITPQAKPENVRRFVETCRAEL